MLGRLRLLSSTALAITIVASYACASDAPPRSEVTIQVKAERYQPSGFPIIVDVTLTNTGTSPISWWCGGPDQYPGAEHFNVRVRYDAEDAWHEVNATNGQYVQGSGFGRPLQPGEAILVPLALPVRKADGVSFQVRPREWQAAEAASGYVQMRGEPRYADVRRARMIEAALAQSPPFWQHFAAQYADPVVIDAMLKLVTLDNAPIVSGAARVLARQKTLPPGASDTLVGVAARWLPRKPLPEWGGLQEDVTGTALKTQSNAIRDEVLKILNETTDANTRRIAMDALRLSPGDGAWLRRAREAIATLKTADKENGDFDRQRKLALQWLDARIGHPEQGR